MATILLLHSALGLRPAVGDFAARLEVLGHDIVTPDFYDGQVYDRARHGIAHRDRIGPPALLDRVRAATTDLPDDAVLAGFSLGAWLAQRLAFGRPRARALILLHSCEAPTKPWPGIHTQLHRYAVDPWVRRSDVAALSAAVAASGAPYEDWVTPGEGHLFTDAGTADWSAEATAATMERIDTFVS